MFRFSLCGTLVIVTLLCIALAVGIRFGPQAVGILILFSCLVFGHFLGAYFVMRANDSLGDAAPESDRDVEKV